MLQCPRRPARDIHQGALPSPRLLLLLLTVFQWFLDKIGHAGLNNLLCAYEDKSAYAQCIFAFTPSPAVAPLVFVGRTNGRIVPARGRKDFGWDPVFLPDGFEGTYAELDSEVKNSISHRGKSLELLKTYLIEHAEEINSSSSSSGKE